MALENSRKLKDRWGEAHAMHFRGTPDLICSDNGAEFTSHKVRGWLQQVNVNALFITPGSPLERALFLA